MAAKQKSIEGTEKPTKTAEEKEQTAEEKEQKPKRVVKRKPLWLCLPIAYDVGIDENGNEISEPKQFEIHRCQSKADVQALLEQRQLDSTNLNYDHVKIFRADPLPLKLTTQVLIKF